MEKILVRVEVPSINQEFDMYIPAELSVGEVTGLIAKAVGEASKHQFAVSGNELLCLREKNVTLKPSWGLRAYGVKNGDHLVLI